MRKFREISPAVFQDHVIAPNFRHGTWVFYLNKALTNTYDFGISFDARGWSNTGAAANHDDGVALGQHNMGPGAQFYDC